MLRAKNSSRPMLKLFKILTFNINSMNVLKIVSGLVFVFLLLLPSPSFAFDESLLPGTVYQTNNSSSLFYLGEDYHRYIFPNEATFLSWFDNFDNVIMVENEIINQTPIGGLVTVNPDGETWVKIQSDPKVYTVSNGGFLHWIPTEEAAEILGGTDWADRVIDLPDTVFAGYTMGIPVDVFSPSLEFDDETAETIDENKNLLSPEQVEILSEEATRDIYVSNNYVSVKVGEPVHFINNSSDWIPEVVLTGDSGTWGSGVIEGGSDWVIKFSEMGFYHYSCRNATDTTAPETKSCGSIVVY